MKLIRDLVAAKPAEVRDQALALMNSSYVDTEALVERLRSEEFSTKGIFNTERLVKDF